MTTAKYLSVISIALSLLALVGCVERTITVRTDPPGALVTVNDVEKGRSPVTFDFTWYGEYRILVEHPQYETLETTKRIYAPLYQWPVIDLVCEVLLPFKFHDQRDWPYTLVRRKGVDTEHLIDRAEDLRQRTETPADQ